MKDKNRVFWSEFRERLYELIKKKVLNVKI